MRKKLKNNLIAALAVIILLAIAVSAAYALLLHETKVDSSVVFGEIKPNAIDFVLSKDIDAAFDAPGSKNSIVINVKSYADIPLVYGYEFAIDSALSDGLEKAIFVYINGDYIGTLSALVSVNGAAAYEKFILPQTETAIDEINDEITFELHNGAQKSRVDGKTCAISVKLKARSIDYEKNIFVKNEDELRLAVDDVNGSGGAVKTIRLCNDIAVTADLNIYNGAAIDFLGGKILAGAHKINILPSNGGTTKTVKFLSSRRIYADNVNASDAIVLNAADTAIEIDDSAPAIGAHIAVLRCDAAKAEEITAAYAEKRLFNGLSLGDTTDVLGGYSFYIRDGVLGITTPTDADYLYSDGTITPAAVESTSVNTINVGNTVIEFDIYPKYSNDAVNVNAIIERELKHVSALSGGANITELTYDIFLPTYIPQYGISINWTSDNPDILNADGICGKDAEGEVTLTATIRYNRDVIIKRYTIKVYKQSNQMRFDYLVARIGEKKMTALYEAATEPEGSYFVLPIVDTAANPDDYRTMYGMSNIGLKSLTYQINPNNTFLIMLGGNKVIMSEATFESYAEVTIRGVFKNEPNKVYQDIIPIDVKLIDNKNLHTAIVEYLQSILDNTDILRNILDTRAADGMENERGDFTLPGYYKGYNINFALTDGTPNYIPDPIIADVTALTGGDGHQNFVFGIDAEKFKNTAHAIEFFVKIKISVEDEHSLPESISALYVDAPPALHSVYSADLESSMFNTIKLQIIEQLSGGAGVPSVVGVVSDRLKAVLNRDYILMHDLQALKRLDLIFGGNIYDKNNVTQSLSENGGYYYFEIGANSFNGAYAALSAMDLLALNVVDGASDSIFGSESGAADKLTAFIGDSYNKIGTLRLSNCVINNQNLFAKMQSLTALDLRGSRISDFDWINIKQNNNLGYLDISDTNFDGAAQSDILAAAYYSYKLGNNTTPTYLYNESGTRVLYAPTQTDNELKLIFYLHCLNKVSELKWDYLQLITKIYGVGGEVLPITWSIAAGGENFAAVTVKTNNGSDSTVMQNLIKNTVPADGKIFETVTLIAEISQNGYTARREIVIRVYY